MGEILKRKSPLSGRIFSKLAEKFPRHNAEQWRERAEELVYRQSPNSTKLIKEELIGKSKTSLLKSNIPKKTTVAKKKLTPIKSSTIQPHSQVASSSIGQIKDGSKGALKKSKKTAALKSSKKISQEREEDEDTVKAKTAKANTINIKASTKSAGKRPAVYEELSSDELDSDEHPGPSSSTTKKKKIKHIPREIQEEETEEDESDEISETSSQGKRIGTFFIV